MVSLSPVALAARQRKFPSSASFALGLLACMIAQAATPKVARADCTVSITRPGPNAQLAVVTNTNSNYHFTCTGDAGDQYHWSVMPASAGSFQTGNGNATGYTPAQVASATVTVQRTCQDGTTSNASVTVRQYQIMAADRPTCNYTVGLDNFLEVPVALLGPDSGPVLIEFSSTPNPGVSFSLDGTTFSCPASLLLSANSGPTDVFFKGAALSGHVNDIEIDHRISIGGPTPEGIGQSYPYTVAQADIDFEGVADETEGADNGGASLRRNSNDSNTDGIRDSTQDNLAADDIDLKYLTVQKVKPEAGMTGTFRTEITMKNKDGSASDGIHAWGGIDNQGTRAKKKTGDHSAPNAQGVTSFEDAVNGGLPKTRALEAQKTGKGTIHGFLKDRGLKRDGTPTVDDTVNLQAVGVFGGLRPGDPPFDDTPDPTHPTLWLGGPWTFMANRDDDDGNGIRDFDQSGAMPVDDDELNEVHFSCIDDVLPWRLTWPQGVRVWADKRRNTSVTSIDFTETLDATGKSLFFETKSLSEGLDDKAFTMSVQYPDGVIEDHDFFATVGVIIGPQYVSQLSRYRYHAIFPGLPLAGNDGLIVTGGSYGNRTLFLDGGFMPYNQGDTADIDWDQATNAQLGTVTFRYPGADATHPRELSWTIDVFKVVVEEGSESEPGLHAYSAPARQPDPGSHWVTWQLNGSSTTACDWHATMIATSPREGFPGGTYLKVGMVHNIQLEHADGEYTINRSLFYKAAVEATASYFFDGKYDNIPWTYPDQQTLLVPGADGLIAHTFSAGDAGAQSVPMVMNHTTGQGGLMPSTQDGSVPSSGDGSIRRTEILRNYKDWVAVLWEPINRDDLSEILMLETVAEEGTVRTWNQSNLWAVAAGDWRSKVSGTHSPASYPFPFTDDGTTKNECHSSTGFQSWSKWTVLNEVTRPAKLPWDSTPAATYNGKYKDVVPSDFKEKTQ